MIPTSVPKPPFHSVSEELLYNIYLKFEDMSSLKETDINTLAKLNAILSDADLMKSEDVISAINAIKGGVPTAGNTLEKLYNIIQGLDFLTQEDIDTLAELNSILSDANLIKTEDLLESINALKGGVPVSADTLGKLYNLLQPVLSSWIAGGNTIGAIKSIGTKDNFALPFITSNIERARFDVNGNFLVGHSDAALGKIHVRTVNALDTSHSLYIEDPTSNLVFGVTNSGKGFFKDVLTCNGLSTKSIQLDSFNVPGHGKIFTDSVFINFVSGLFRGMQFWTAEGSMLLMRLGNTAVFETGKGFIHNDEFVDEAGGRGYLMIDGAKYTRSGTIWWGDPVGEAGPRENSVFPNATRSLGARLIFKRINAVGTGDFGLGYEPNFLWLSASKNDNTNGFKFYGKNVEILKILGNGDIISPATAIFYFGEENTEGTWRIMRYGEDLAFERFEFGNYYRKETIYAYSV